MARAGLQSLRGARRVAPEPGAGLEPATPSFTMEVLYQLSYPGGTRLTVAPSVVPPPLMGTRSGFIASACPSRAQTEACLPRPPSSTSMPGPPQRPSLPAWALQLVVSTLALQLVLAGLAVQPVVAGSTVQGVVTGAAVDHVIASAGVHHVVAGTAVDHVVTGGTRGHVVTGGALDGAPDGACDPTASGSRDLDREAPRGGRRVGMSEVVGGAYREGVGAVGEVRVGLRRGGAVREASRRRPGAVELALEGRVGLAGGVGEAWAVVVGGAAGTAGDARVGGVGVDREGRRGGRRVGVPEVVVARTEKV